MKNRNLMLGAAVGAVVLSILMINNGSASADSQRHVTTKTLANGKVQTTTVEPDGSSFTVVGPSLMSSDVQVTSGVNADGTQKVSVDGFVVAREGIAEDALAPQALVSSGDQGCGGKTPAVAYSFNGKTSAGTYEGAWALCRDSAGSTRAYGLDKMFMRAKGTTRLIGCCDHIPDTFWVQTYTHNHASPKLLSAEPNSSISDTAGPCTSYSVGVGGNVASAGMSGSVCRGTMSPILSHSIGIDGQTAQSYGVKYEGKNLLMNGSTVYGIKGVGWRSTARYSAAKPYYNFIAHSGVRWHVDYDNIG